MAERLLDGANAREHRAMLEANLAHECDIQTDTSVINAGGGRIPVWTSAVAVVPCQLSPTAAGAEGLRNDQHRVISSWRVRFPAGTIVTDANRLVVTGENRGVAFERKLMVTGLHMTETAVVVTARDCTPAEL